MRENILYLTHTQLDWEMYRKFLKRTLDLIGALLGVIIFTPVYIILIILLLIANRGGVFFVQPRPGKDEKIFKIIKFKTMNNKRDLEGNLLPPDERITKTGAFLRKTSLDEIPQLINVIKGDMSFVGPRPLLVEYLPLYNDAQKKRHNVRPGITGWAQVNGRNAISWDEKFRLDVWYVDNLSFRLDLKIILLTIKKVLKKEDVYTDQNTIMSEFVGERA